jgi:hypothetical protein
MTGRDGKQYVQVLILKEVGQPLRLSQWLPQMVVLPPRHPWLGQAAR